MRFNEKTRKALIKRFGIVDEDTRQPTSPNNLSAKLNMEDFFKIAQYIVTMKEQIRQLQLKVAELEKR